MTLSINNLMESICNPSGRFRRLEGLSVKLDPDGYPWFVFSSMAVWFVVYWRNREYALKVFLKSGTDEAARMKRLAVDLPRYDSPYLIPYEYLSGEMLVFDDRNRAHYADVMLMESLEGMTLDKRLAELCARDDKARIGKLLGQCCRMGAWLISHNVVHNRLSPGCIFVDRQDRIRLVDYRRMDIVKDREGDLDGDNMAVANIALAIKLLASDPSLFRVLRGNALFRRPEAIRSSLLPLIMDAALQAGCMSAYSIAEMLASCNCVLRRRHELAGLLEELSGDGTDLKIDSSRLSREDEEADDDAPEQWPVSRASADLSGYSWAGPVCESMICVEKNGAWGYLYSDGTEAIPLKFDWADDFAEGRAEVAVGNSKGLIDKTGLMVIPAVYEEVAWDYVHGCAIVTREGNYGVFDRDGHELVPLIYDWMGDANNILIVARRQDGLFGYIRHNGEIAIDFHFEDAYDFCGDRALVSEKGRSFYIDPKGNFVAPGEDEQAVPESRLA